MSGRRLDFKQHRHLISRTKYLDTETHAPKACSHLSKNKADARRLDMAVSKVHFARWGLYVGG